MAIRNKYISGAGAIILGLLTLVTSWPLEAASAPVGATDLDYSRYHTATDALCKATNVPPMRGDKGTEQLRVWKGFGLKPLRGLILKKTATGWKALELVARSRARDAQIHPAASKGSLEDLWRVLMELEIHRLPDGRSLGITPDRTDGTSFFVEINDGSTYRAYVFANPVAGRSAEEGRFVEIVRTMCDALSIDRTQWLNGIR